MSTENRILRQALFLLSIAGLLFTLCYHVALILYPLPTEYREAAPLITTEMMLRGINPFSFNIQPEAVNVYGIVYHYFVLPFAYVFGNTLQVHKLVSGIFILGCLFIMHALLRKSGVRKDLIPLALLICYQAFLYSVTATVRPDSCGLFFMLLGVYIPYSRNFSLPSIVVGCLMGTVGFYSKPYFILGNCFLFVWIFCFRSKILAVKAFIIFLVAFSLIAVGVNHLYEAYFYNTYLVNKNVATFVFLHMFKQLVALVEYNLGIVVLFVAFLIARRKAVADRLLGLFRFHSLRKFQLPLLRGYLSLWDVSFILGMFLFMVKLGGHVGNSMIYIFQLAFPFMILSFFARITLMKRNVLFYGLAIVNIFLAVYLNRWLVDTDENRSKWALVAGMVSSHNQILNSPAVGPTIFKAGKKVYDSGQNEYFHNSSRTKSSMFPYTDTIAALNQRYLQDVDSRLAAGNFDLLLLPKEETWLTTGQNIEAAYQRKDSMQLYMPHARQVWDIVVWERK